eukprot:6274058-Amphidinium_carterae.1
MGLAVLAAVIGYLCIFMAHLPKKTFFGYNFESQTWLPKWTQIAHAWLGYAILLGSLVQGFIGPMKVSAINGGHRKFTWHGQVGKLIMLGASIVLCLAVSFQAWTWQLKIVLYTLVPAS